MLVGAGRQFSDNYEGEKGKNGPLDDK